MAIDKPLTVRDYLELRPVSAAGSRRAPAVRRSLASFQDILKSGEPEAAKETAAGMKISEYLKHPVLRAQTARQKRQEGASSEIAVTPPGRSNSAKAGDAADTGSVESGGPAPVQGNRSARPSRRSTRQPFRVETGGHPVETSIQQAAAKYNLSPSLIRSVIRAESNFQADAVSPAGAKGLMQLMPETARELGVADPFDVRQNIDGGSRYLRQMLDRFGGNLKLALAAYNAGPGAVEQYNGEVPYLETKQYVKRVLGFAGMKA